MSIRSRRRSVVTTIIAIVALTVALLLMTVTRINNLFRRKLVNIDELKFPILAVAGVGESPYAAWDSFAFRNISRTARLAPTNGMTVIDSDFKMVTLENVTYNNGDLAWIGRALFPALGFRYRFDLRLNKVSGLESALECLAHFGTFTDNPADDAEILKKLSTQSTMEGILATLGLQKPVQPPATTEPAPTERDPSITEPLP